MGSGANKGTVKLWGANGKKIELGETQPVGRLNARKGQSIETDGEGNAPARTPHAPAGPLGQLRRPLFARFRRGK